MRGCPPLLGTRCSAPDVVTLHTPCGGVPSHPVQVLPRFRPVAGPALVDVDGRGAWSPAAAAARPSVVPAVQSCFDGAGPRRPGSCIANCRHVHRDVHLGERGRFIGDCVGALVAPVAAVGRHPL